MSGAFAPTALVELDLSGQRILTAALLESISCKGALAQLCVLRVRRTALDKVLVCVCVCVIVNVHVYEYVCTCIHVCVYIYIYVYIYV